MAAFFDVGIAFQISWESKGWSKADEHEVNKEKKRKSDDFKGSFQVLVEKQSTAGCFGMSLEEVEKKLFCLPRAERKGSVS